MTCLYEVELATAAGHVQFIRAYGIDRITDPIGIPDMRRVAELFPGIDIQRLHRTMTTVDILVGNDNPDALYDGTIAKSVTGCRIRESVFGWLLHGPLVPGYDGSLSSNVIGCHAVVHAARVDFIKRGMKSYVGCDDLLPGKKSIKVVSAHLSAAANSPPIDLSRFSSGRKLIRIVARILMWREWVKRKRLDSSVKMRPLTPELLQAALHC